MNESDLEIEWAEERYKNAVERSDIAWIRLIDAARRKDENINFIKEIAFWAVQSEREKEFAEQTLKASKNIEIMARGKENNY